MKEYDKIREMRKKEHFRENLLSFLIVSMFFVFIFAGIFAYSFFQNIQQTKHKEKAVLTYSNYDGFSLYSAGINYDSEDKDKLSLCYYVPTAPSEADISICNDLGTKEENLLIAITKSPTLDKLIKTYVDTSEDSKHLAVPYQEKSIPKVIFMHKDNKNTKLLLTKLASQAKSKEEFESFFYKPDSMKDELKLYKEWIGENEHNIFYDSSYDKTKYGLDRKWLSW